MNLAHHVVDDSRHVLLEKVRFESIKRARQILREKFQRFSTSLVFGRRRSLKDLGIHCTNLFEDLLAVLQQLLIWAAD